MKITRHNGKNQPYTLLIDRYDLALYRRYKWQRHTKGLIRYTGEKKGKGCVLLHREMAGVPATIVAWENSPDFASFKTFDDPQLLEMRAAAARILFDMTMKKTPR